MEGLLLFLLFAVPIACIFLVLIGIVKLFSRDAETRRSGSRLLLTGCLIFGVVILIGFSICSGAF